MLKKKILIGTGNEGKFKEFKFYIEYFKIFKHFKILDLSSQDIRGEPNENGDTFESNASSKSSFYFKKTKIPTLSDDSGFIIKNSIDFPGVKTARFAIEQGGITKAVNHIYKKYGLECNAIPATFFCSLNYLDKDNEISANGMVEGKIIKNKRGHNGFGFDPFFVPKGHKKTFAEMEKIEKLILSHRYFAFLDFKKKISQILLGNLL